MLSNRMFCDKHRFIVGLIIAGLIAIGVFNNFAINNEKKRLIQRTEPHKLNRTYESKIAESKPKKFKSESLWPTDDNDTTDRITIQLNLAHSMNMSGRLNSSKLKTIFYVGHENYEPPPPSGNQQFTSLGCPVSACSLTMNLTDLKKADAVYFQTMRNNVTLKTFLPKPVSQLWIFFQREPPPVSSALGMFSTRDLNNLINWTITYRPDSTIPTPYGKFETFSNYTRIENHPIPKGINYASGKTKKVGWFVSNCKLGTHSGRYDYATELSKYIDVDIYGKCGRLQCPKNKYDECLQVLRRDYKFYLSFENNCCKEYITEKLFVNALQNDLVPIVLGAPPEDYKAMAPPGSYIHVDDFESPKALADYLHLLDKNDTLYNEYFRWKTTGTFFKREHEPWCRLCALLHANDNANYVHWYKDIHTWWEEGTCLEKVANGTWQSWRRRN